MRYKWDTLQREFTCCGGYGYTQVLHTECRTIFFKGRLFFRLGIHAERDDGAHDVLTARIKRNIRIFWRYFAKFRLTSSKYLNKYGLFSHDADKICLFRKKYKVKSAFFVNCQIFAGIIVIFGYFFQAIFAKLRKWFSWKFMMHKLFITYYIFLPRSYRLSGTLYTQPWNIFYKWPRNTQWFIPDLFLFASPPPPHTIEWLHSPLFL